MYTSLDKAAKAIELLVEGCSIATVERVTGLHHTTILSLLVLVGDKCERLLENRIRNLPVSDVQCDEIWAFVGCKEKNNVNGDPLRGDAYCFIALERNTKVVLTWHLGRRNARDTFAFTEKVNEATQGHFQITTDGFKPYIDAVHTSLGTRVDFAQLIKVYSSPRDAEVRYSPAEVVDSVPVPQWGNPALNRICTSHVERQNLSIRMGMRRMTRLTNAFSKKWHNLKAAYAVWFAFYNFCRVHKTLRVTPAMQAGITDHAWTITELLRAVA
jgi:IS1 family transposase